MPDFHLQAIRCVSAKDSQGGRQSCSRERYVLPDGLAHLILHVSGFKTLDLLGRTHDTPPPFLAIHPAGVAIDFQFTRQREDWVAILETDMIRVAAEGDRVDVLWENVWVTIPAYLPLSKMEAGMIRDEFRAAHDGLLRPIPKNRFLAAGLVWRVLCRMVESDEQDIDTSAPLKLKERIDQGALLERTLDQLSHECGYSSDHLRRLFCEAYGVNPSAYWQQVRISRAMQLFVGTDLGIAQMSERLGFTHMAHFCRLCRDAFGCTPREAIRRYRYRTDT